MNWTIVYADPPKVDPLTQVVIAGTYNTTPLELRATLADGRVAITGLSQGVFREHPDIPADVLEKAHAHLKSASALVVA